MGAGKSLFGGFTVPLRGLDEVFRHTPAEPVQMPEIPLGSRVPRLGQRQPFLVGGVVVARLIGSEASRKVGTGSSRQADDEDGQ